MSYGAFQYQPMSADTVPVTAEVASSSLVVPAIHCEAFSEWSFHSSLLTISEGEGPEIWHPLLFWVSDKFRASPRLTAFYFVPRKRSTISGSIGSTASV